MMKRKEIIIPGITNKIIYVLNKVIPIRMSKYVLYISQNGKRYY